MVFQLLYVSGATRQLDDAEILGILETSRRNNARLGVTGMLLHADGTFIQLLEGGEQVVRILAARIAADTRHRNFMVMMERQADRRAFGEWQMGFKALSRAVAEHRYAFQLSRAGVENRISAADGGLVLDMILAFAGREFLGAE